jgi:hypothetical protein
MKSWIALIGVALLIAGLGVQSATADSYVTTGITATNLGTCDGITQVTLTIKGNLAAGSATGLHYHVVPAAGWQVATASASSGTTVHTSSSVDWALSLLGGATITVNYTLLHTGITGGPAVPIQSTALLQMTENPNDPNPIPVSQDFSGTTVSVSGCNEPPQADAGIDQTIYLNDGSPTALVSLDGSGSTDDGQIQPLTYRWSENGVTIATGVAPIGVPITGGGRHVITLTVFDGQFTSTDTLVITIFTDANIQITPAAGVNRVGQPHTFTAHVNVNLGDGQGYRNAPDGTPVTFTVDSGPGSPTAPAPCTTVGTTGSCSSAFNSSVTGLFTVSAHTSLPAGNQQLNRDTDGLAPNSAPATKRYVDAKIALTSAASTTNPVRQPHTFTVTHSKDTGTGSFVAAVGEHVSVVLTASNGAVVAASPTGSCTTAGANTDANGQCTITFVSSTPGLVTAHAVASLLVDGIPIALATDGADRNGPDFVKTYVDATIKVTPATAVNLIGTTHVLTGHVDVNTGAGTPANAPDGTTIDFAIVSGPGSFVGASSCQTSSGTGSCTVVITSSTVGTTIVNATGTVTVSGLSLTRSTGDGKSGDSANAAKTWNPLPPCVLGYPDSSRTPRSSAVFNESEVLVSAAVYGSGASQHVGLFYTDEHAMLLGLNPNVSPYPGSPPSGGLTAVSVGVRTAVDPYGRPLYPALFATDITASAADRSGDWQQRGDNTTAMIPTGVYGSWKAATQSGTSIVPGADPSGNGWNLGTGADPAPTGSNSGFGTEVQWNTTSLGLIPGHVYRLQFMVHDGDQNKTGGDVGEACVNVLIPLPEAPRITSAPATTFGLGLPGSFSVAATGNPSATFSETGALPLGVTLTPAGLLTGTPAAGSGGTYPITITASNGVNPDATQSFVLTVDPFPISGLKFNFSSYGGSGSAATWGGCTGPVGTNPVVVNCTSTKTANTRTIIGTVSLFNGTSLPGTAVANSTGSPIAIAPTASPSGSSATTATIPIAGSTSNSVTVAHAGNQVWTYAYTAPSGVVYKLQLTITT